MKQMKTEQCKTGKVYIIICRDFEKIVGYGIEILRIAPDNTQPHEVKVEKMKHKKCKDRCTGPYHEL
jgi:hypothetical protein